MDCGWYRLTDSLTLCVHVVMSDERCQWRSVNKPMTCSEMEHQLLKHLHQQQQQQQCDVSRRQQRQPVSSCRERMLSESSEMMSNQPLGAYTYIHTYTQTYIQTHTHTHTHILTNQHHSIGRCIFCISSFLWMYGSWFCGQLMRDHIVEWSASCDAVYEGLRRWIV